MRLNANIRPVQDQAVRQTIALYKKVGWKSIFAKMRFWDAPYFEAENVIPKEGKIVELGCGEGFFSNFLAISSPKRNVVGVEIDKARVKDAQRGLNNTKFICQNALKAKIEASAIVCMHLLHHLNSREDQEFLLTNCYKSLPRNGKLVIIEVDPKFSFKYFITWFTDHFLVSWLFEKKIYSPIYFRRGTEWQRLLKKIGFSCKIAHVEKGKPFTHIMLTCQKN